MLATDEVYTYAIMNYADITWSSHTEAGGDTTGGEGGVPAYVSFQLSNSIHFVDSHFPSSCHHSKIRSVSMPATELNPTSTSPTAKPRCFAISPEEAGPTAFPVVISSASTNE